MFRKTCQLTFVLILNALSCLAQSGLVFDRPAWDFGTIRETDGPVTHRFVCRNEGEHPEVILQVTTTCGCTTPRYTRKPILPGEEAEITVTYDPANRPGNFSRELAVFTADRRIAAKLRITGSVIGRPKTPEELYPIDCGDGLRLEDNFHAFTYIYNGRTSVATIGYANLSDKPLTLELRPEEASGLLQADYPRRIAPNERGVLTFSYDLPADNPRYGTLKELLTVCIDGRPTRTDIFLHGFAVDDPRRVEQENAPKWQVNKNIINFGPVKRTGAPAERSLTLGNYGKSALITRPGVRNRGDIRCVAAGLRSLVGAIDTYRQRPRASDAEHPPDGRCRRVRYEETRPKQEAGRKKAGTPTFSGRQARYRPVRTEPSGENGNK